MSKYEPLPQFLAAKPGSVHRMSFDQIERVLGFKLPRSAYDHEAWWSNNATGHSHARVWLEAGWQTMDVDLDARKVSFQRLAPSASLPGKSPKRDPWGCLAGTVTIMPGVDVTAPAGETWTAQTGRLLNE